MKPELSKNSDELPSAIFRRIFEYLPALLPVNSGHFETPINQFWQKFIYSLYWDTSCNLDFVISFTKELISKNKCPKFEKLSYDKLQ